MLKSKALLLEKEAWGCFTASLAGTKTSGLWDILEDLFAECSESKEEGLPSKKICQEDETSTSSDPLKFTSSTAPSSNIVIPMSESSPHDSGRSQEFLPLHGQLPHRKAVYLCAFYCGYCAQSRTPVCTHTCKEHLNTMLGCPHCDHDAWSTDVWVKHVPNCHFELPMFLELKLKQVSPAGSTEVLDAVGMSQNIKK